MEARLLQSLDDLGYNKRIIKDYGALLEVNNCLQLRHRREVVVHGSACCNFNVKLQCEYKLT